MINKNDGKKIEKKQFDSNAYWLMFAQLATQFAFIFALPLIGAVYIGRWLDTKYHSQQFIVGLVIIAIITSWYIVYKKIKTISELIKK